MTGDPAETTAPKFWHLDTSWDDIPSVEHPGGIVTKQLTVGHPEHSDGPHLVWARFPPGYTVDPHTHGCDYAEIILEGSQQVGRTWHHEGAVRVVQSGTTYGPLVAGPDGVTALVIFASRHHIAVIPAGGSTPTEATP